MGDPLYFHKFLVLVAYYFRFAVLADCLKAFAVGAPFAPGFLIFSPLPALIRFRLAWMFAYSPFFFAGINQPFFHLLELDFVLLGFHLTLSAHQAADIFPLAMFFE